MHRPAETMAALAPESVKQRREWRRDWLFIQKECVTMITGNCGFVALCETYRETKTHPNSEITNTNLGHEMPNSTSSPPQMPDTTKVS